MARSNTAFPQSPWYGKANDTALLDSLLPTVQRLAGCARPAAALEHMLRLAARGRAVANGVPLGCGPCRASQASDGRLGAGCICSSPHEHMLMTNFVRRGAAGREAPAVSTVPRPVDKGGAAPAGTLEKRKRPLAASMTPNSAAGIL